MNLVEKYRPNTFDEIVGQERIVSIIKNMINKNSLQSLILFGPPGIGKTSIAKVIQKQYKDTIFFNASCDKKQDLKKIEENNIFYNQYILIVDEIHRMKKDIQDYLLPFVENRKVILIGLTTENPYRELTQQLRSRVLIYELDNIKENSLLDYLKNISIKEYNELLDDSIYKLIINKSTCEIRSALNLLELVYSFDDKSIDNIKNILSYKNITIDDSISYYDVLSALIKSIRGSDCDAAIHYLARFLTCGDIEMLVRRLLISFYEDVSLANPNLGPKIKAACDAALYIGLPEARIPLSYCVIELALSKKSNSSYLAINNAISDLDNIKDFSIPHNILNRCNDIYLYPFDYKDNFIKQKYLNDELFNKEYYTPKNNDYENNLKDILNNFRTILKKK